MKRKSNAAELCAKGRINNLRYKIECPTYKKPEPVKVKSFMLRGFPFLLHEIVREMYRRMDITHTYSISRGLLSQTCIRNDDHYFDADMIDAINEELILLREKGVDLWFPKYEIKLVYSIIYGDLYED